jgi:diguanylate cyclase (GGDEF)-like protein/PAS domain S-box-containing protein
VTQVFPAIGEKTMRLNARRLEWKRRTPALILLAIEDITARKHAAEALQQARDELEMRVQERTAALKAEILERARAEEALFAEKEQLRITLAAIGDGVITTGSQGRVESLNRVAEQLTGQTEAQAQGRPLAEVFKIVNDDTREPADDPVQRCLREGEIVELADHSLLLRPDGTEIAIEDSAAPILNRAGRMAGVVLIFRDVTEKRRNARELHYQASHDALTGLINRHEFERRLQRVLKTSDGEHALLYLDLDQFKIVNDTCGHTAGDELLRQLATLMATQVRKRDTLARLGGDEFGVLLEHCSVEQALRLAQTLQQTVQDFRFTCDNKHFTAGVSIGLVPIPQGGDTLAQVLSAADSACYAAKDKGRNRIHVYAASDEELTQRHGQMQWIPRLHQALADGHLRLYFQPIVPVTGEVTGGVHGELLLRLVGEDGQIVSPGSFLPAAERYHQVQPLDRWVIRAALAAVRTQAAPRVVNYGINLSGQSLGDTAFLDFVLEQLAQSGVPPQWICFEVTETAAIADLKHARHFIKTLKQRGCRFALDDFGSGLSSFSYLKTLPVDYLKIDGAFVRDMVTDPIDCAMVEAIHRVGQIMGIKTIAESVENEAILEKLKAIGVDYAQGYEIAKPHPLS